MHGPLNHPRTALISAFPCCALFFLLHSSSIASAAAVSPGNKLFLILLDGFRWNYFEQFGAEELKGFEALRTQGASAKRLIPSFPSLSFPNYYSLMTGLHAESHGQVDNYMWDEKHNTEFLIGENADQYEPYWWDDGEPLWITAKKQGRRSYFWYWCGCEVEIRGSRPDFCQEYLSSPNPSFENFTRALDSAVEVLRNGSADIVGVYLEQIDHWGHAAGPDSDVLREKIEIVDAELARIQTVLESTRFEGESTGSMFDRVNLILFSDHGMVERVGGASDNRSAVIHLLDYVNASDYERAMGSSNGPTLHIWPHPGQLDWLYDRLAHAHPNMTVYKKEDIPAKYHFKGHYRVAPIFLLADKGYVFLRNPAVRTLTNIGYHGYDPVDQDVHGILFTRGPAFKKNEEMESLVNIDLYGMMCNVIGVKASPHNGTVTHTCPLVSNPSTCTGVALRFQAHSGLVVWQTCLALAFMSYVWSVV